jgi:hypothetical protein
MELGTVSFYGCHPLFKGFADIYQEIGFMVPVLHVVEDELGSPFILWCTRIVQGDDLLQSGQEAGIRYQVTCPSVVGMPVVEDISDDDLGSVFPYDRYELHLVRFIVSEEAIAHAQILPDGQSHDPGGNGGFGIPCRHGTAGAQFSFGEVYHTGGLPVSLLVDERSGTAQFHIIGMYADG